MEAQAARRHAGGPASGLHLETAKLISKHYAVRNLCETTWDEALAELATARIRPKTLVTYKTAVANLRAVLPDTKGPSSITEELANRFHRLYAATPFRRGKASDAKEYTRSPQTVYNAIANLSIVWSHFADLGYVKRHENPWEEVKRPTLPKRQPSIPTDESFKTLFAWLEMKYPGWELLRLFVELKMFAGCRLNDLCQLRSDQLRGETLVILPEQDKTNCERHVPLPAGLARRLHAVKGATYLWERYTEDTKTYRPGPARTDTFAPSVMYNAMKSFFRAYGRAHPEAKIKSHDLRKRGLTMTSGEVGVDRAAAAMGVTAETARKYYVDQKRAFDGAEVFRQMGQKLLLNSDTILTRKEGV
ncbi:MAG TPA: tyrosine-type recombinase/integrase [Fimbriiglobus sp.]|nr:tyrosine-type recombinase/integrase [Fimbriiglobus sp.]